MFVAPSPAEPSTRPARSAVSAAWLRARRRRAVGAVRRWSLLAVSPGSVVRRSEGQATAEYVLVLLGAASVALVLIGWLARSGRIEGLLELVFDRITAQL